MAPGWSFAAHHVFMATACREDYGTIIHNLCFSRFQESMDAIGKTLWCDWGKTIG